METHQNTQWMDERKIAEVARAGAVLKPSLTDRPLDKKRCPSSGCQKEGGGMQGVLMDHPPQSQRNSSASRNDNTRVSEAMDIGSTWPPRDTTPG